MNDGRVCRVCLAPESTDFEFASVFAKDSKMALRIFLISGVQIIENEENDALICEICIKELHCADLFRVKCLEADRIFRLKTKNENPVNYVFGLHETNEDVLAARVKEENEKVNNSRIQNGMEQITPKQFSFIKLSQRSRNLKAQCHVGIFSRTALRRRHVQEMHNESKQTHHAELVNLKRNENAQCQICNRIFRRNGTLRLHLEKVHSKKSFACDLCGDQFLLKMSLLKHLRTNHDRFKVIKFKRNENAQCPICNRSFSRRDTMKNHVTKIHNTKLKLTCDLCGDQFILKASLQKHIKDCHLKIRRNRRVEVICSVCGKILTTLSGLQQHMRRHEEISKAESYQCSKCFKKFKTSVALKGHEVRAHEKRYERKCPLCPSTFSGLSNFNLHYKRIHLNQRDFKCMVCDKDFVTKTLLKIHQTVHTGEKKHECIHCQMRFRLYESKKKHEKRCLRKMTFAGFME